MSGSGAVPPIVALLQVDHGFIDRLSPEERLVLPYLRDLWLRPEQRVARGPWRYHGFIAGRGWGKSLTIAAEVDRRVRAGEARAIALMAPTDTRAEEVQIKFLVDVSPPWFKAERHRGGVRWPNGVTATTFTPEAPGRSRSENLDLSWLCEIVDWKDTTRREAFNNITTATRVGRAQVLWDTTSRGRNDVISHLLDLNEMDPATYPITRGTTFDNPLLSRVYLAGEVAKYVGREFAEELLGEVFGEAAGALYRAEWLDRYRETRAPNDYDLRLVALDPALSNRADSDETGIVTGRRVRGGDCYIDGDASGRYPPEEWGDIALQEVADHGAAGVIVERNHLGDNATFVLRSRATSRGIQVRVLDAGRPFPVRTPGVCYVREVVAVRGKAARASGPAAEMQAGRVHLVGHFPRLEAELTTYAPGASKSPNRYDAMNYLVTELRGLGSDDAPRDSGAEAATMARAHNELRERLRGSAGRGLY